jgi:hypothetical protein
MRRYARTAVMDLGSRYGTSYMIPTIREAIQNGSIRYQTVVLRGGERLDTLAGKFYNSSKLYWILCAASNIGWAQQVPPGTMICVPSLDDVMQLFS